jgi:O-antigen/teichoic acid export membrane protein
MTGPARAERPPLAAQWLWTLGTQSTTYLVTALLIVAARVLGSEEFGHWSFAFALTLLLTPLTDLGASVYAGVIIARDGHRRAELVDNVLGLRLAAAPAYTALCAGAAALLLGRADVALLAALLAVDNAARGAATTFHVAFRAHGVFALETWATIAERGAIVALGGLALAAHPTFLAFTAAALLGRLAGLAVSAAVYARRFEAPRPRFVLRVWRELVRRGSPLGLRATFSALGAHVDRVALGTFRPAMEVGWYGAAYQPFRGLGILPEVLANPMAPAVARAYGDRGLAAALPLFHRTLRYLVVAALPAVVGVSLLARPIIHLLYGDEYLPAAPALRLLIWTALLAFAQHTACVFLDNVDRRGFTVWAYALSLGLAVALELLLIPRFGYLGAAAAMLASAVVSCALLFGYLAREGLGPPVGRVALGPGAAALAAAAILWPAGDSVTAAVPLGAAALAAYALLLRATGAWGADDTARLRSAWAGLARRPKGARAATALLALLLALSSLVILPPALSHGASSPPPAPAAAPSPPAAPPGTFAIPANTWVPLHAGRGPGGRGWFQASFDTTAGEVIVFGGSGDTYLSDTWAYGLDINAWRLLRGHPDLAGPCRRDNHNVLYDPGGRRHWLFNGIAYDNLQPGCAGAVTRSGVWTYDRAANRWTRETVAGEHSLIAPGMAYNPDDRSFLEFGGSRENPTNATSRFDIAARAWTRLSPAGALPAPRINIEGGLVYDRASRVFVLFGGSDAKSDTWLFDPATRTWRDVTPAGPPPGRELHAMAYDEANGVVILAGGRGADGAVLSDTWVWSTPARAWRRLAAPGLPPVYHHSAVYHPGRRVVLLIPGLGLGDVYVLRHAP